MAGTSRDRALSLLAAANNHGDLAVKVSSLKQVRDILLSIEPSVAAELFPYLVELQSSPESLIRKMLIEVIEDIGLKSVDNSSLLMSVLVALLKDEDSFVARQAVNSGTNIFCNVLEEMALQFYRRGRVERWLEELWTWMLKFKDVVFTIALEPTSIGTRLQALKSLETYVLLFTSDVNDSEKFSEGRRQAFNISWLAGGHPILDQVVLSSDAKRTLALLLNFLRSGSSLPGAFTITVVNCLAAIARKRTVYYNTVLSALLDFNMNTKFETVKGFHAPSVQFSLRSAFLGFLRCPHPDMAESKEMLVKVIREMNLGDATDQAIKQVEKLIKATDRVSREAWSVKDDQPSSQPPVLVDMSRKRSTPLDYEDLASNEMASKRVRFGSDIHSTSPLQKNDSMPDSGSINGGSPDIPILNGKLTPVEQMIAMIGALLAEGERGADSLKILISNIHPDVLADIVITNMKHLPKAPSPLTRLGDLPVNHQVSSLMQSPATAAPTNSVQSPVLTGQPSFSMATSISSSMSDAVAINVLLPDSKRDPRRDPRRLDPRRLVVPSIPSVEEPSPVHTEVDGSVSLSTPASVPTSTTVENPSEALMLKVKTEDRLIGSPFISAPEQLTPKEEVLDRPEEAIPILEVYGSSNPAFSAVQKVEEEITVDLSDDAIIKEDDTSSFTELSQHSPSALNSSTPEETCQELPLLPSYLDLTPEQQTNVKRLAVERIFDSCKDLCGTDCQQIRLALLARLVAQVDDDGDVVAMLQKHVVVDYQRQKGHELVLHVLYHLHSLTISRTEDSSSVAASVYEKFLLTVAKSLLDSFPASDKSLSRLLGEVPVLPDSMLKLLDDLCYSDFTDNTGNNKRDVERVTQGLGTIWTLIMKRPHYRSTCLDIALKCAVHSQDEIRATAIRLVANKLYQLSYISENIEQYATNMLNSAVDQHVPDAEPGSSEQRAKGELEIQETSISGSQISEPGTSENDSQRGLPIVQSSSTLSFSEAQRFISLFFALCIKKPSLLQLVFNAYGRAPKAVKQAVHRHIPILIRALGSSYSELLGIISDPPQGSEHLLTLVLQVLTQETVPSADLIATVKHLYETKLKDVTILIPMLSSLSKNEVLPIFPRLVELPLDKFQRALAHILQGSAHTGPALTPAEVLVAIHGIVPEKDGVALKKVMDACSTCFEQRTVFTQQVLAKALNYMVDQTPLPLLFMRTVIQAIDAFPTLVDFVMEIFSKLVSKQVWRMPKLWFGFLKCAFQTQPHSFQVLLELPPPQLENALNKYATLRSPLAAYASQPSIKSTLSRPTLAVLGLEKEANNNILQQPHRVLTSHSSDACSSVGGSTLT